MSISAIGVIMEGTIAVRNGLKAEDIAKTIHPHPSLSETVMESAHGMDVDMIHQVFLKWR
jgi:dihydrolipoamide dehydrogenase